jgi:hypothetical protein
MQLVAGREEAKEPSGGSVLRLIQIRLATPRLEKISPACQAKSRQPADRRFQFQKRSQLFIRTHHETLSVVAM